MNHYYECDNILNSCCDKHKKRCYDEKQFKKHKKHKKKCYPDIPLDYGAYAIPNSYNTYPNISSTICNPKSYDNTLVLLLIIVLLCNCNPCCED